MMDIKTKIGLRIKEVRKEKKLKQESVAYKAEVGRTFMNKIENGKNNVSIDSLQKIVCDGLGITLHEFFGTDLFLTGKYF